jgi:hypothetical protein
MIRGLQLIHKLFLSRAREAMENYPAKFSPEARAAVEAELIRAGRLHDKRKREWKSDWSFPEGQSLQTCILSVFLVYAREAKAPPALPTTTGLFEDRRERKIPPRGDPAAH